MISSFVMATKEFSRYPPTFLFYGSAAIPHDRHEKDMSAKSEKILEMLKSHEIKTEESLEALQAGISHLPKKIWYYTLVNDAVKNNKVLPKWEEV